MKAPSTWRLGIGAIAALIQIVAPGSLSAQILDSFVDTLYIQSASIPQGKFDAGDTIWVGLGVVNTFPVGGMSYRLELPDTSRIVPFYTFAPGEAFFVPARLVDRGLPYDKPQAVTSAAIRHPDTANVVTGLLVDFQGTAIVPSGSGSLLQLAFRAKSGIQIGDSTAILVRDKLSDPLDPRNSLSDTASAHVVYPRLRDGVLHFAAGPVLIDVTTNLGIDTVLVGYPSSIVFTVDANGNSIQGLVFPFELPFSTGNWIGPLSDQADSDPLNNVVPSSEATAGFHSIAFNPNYGTGSNPDTLLYGFTSFAGPWTSSGELFRINFTPTQPGTVRFDSTFLPPANTLEALDPLAVSLPLEWRGDGKDIESILIFDCFGFPPPSCRGDSGFPTVAVLGDAVAGNLLVEYDPGLPASYFIVEAVNSQSTGPNLPMVIDSNGHFTWQTSSSNTLDAGHWTIQFGVTLTHRLCGDYTMHCAPVEFDVIGAQPLICFELGCAEAFSGSDICVPLTVTDYFNPCVELGGFDLLFKYDASLLSFKGVDLDGSILESQGWEYLTYRVVSSNPALIRIVAIADMNNSNHHPTSWCLDGLVANICFRTTNDRNLACQSAWLMFYWDDCGDNTASSRDGNHLYIVADPAGGSYVGGISGVVDGGGIIMSSCGVDAQIFSGEGNVTGPVGHPCANTIPNKPDPEQLLCFANGKIKITCPGDIDDRGDVNLNGLAYEIADAVLYSNYFIQGPTVFGTGVQAEARIAASDINADGTPLTVADLVYLIRVITGDALPIAGDVLGGGPKVAAAGQVKVEALVQGAVTTIKSSSDLDMGAGLFVFNYSGTEISKVEVLGRASDMDVAFQAENGELRVLMYNIEDGHKVAAGFGEILSVVSTGGGEVELVNVEAASFMGGALEANVTARVLPTQFALKQNFPNPFNPSTRLSIDFPQASDYKLTIYNIAGQTVKSYSGNTEAGTLTLTWDGRDARGTSVATGVYFYSVEAGAFHDAKKMVLMK